MTESILNEYSEGLIFYGSYAQSYYSNAKAYRGLVYSKQDFNSLKKENPVYLPEPNAYFHELDGKHSCIEGVEFVKEFKDLEEYYLWLLEKDVDLDSAAEQLFYNKELDSEKLKGFLDTSDKIHKIMDWENLEKSLISLIDKLFERKITLVKKETVK